MRVLITDGGERVALAVARSLVRADHEVYVAAPTRLSLAGVSRGVRPCVLASDALSDPAAYVAEIARLVERERIELLLPLTDPSVEALLEYRGDLPPGLLLPFPDLATYRAASDKAHVLTVAQASGFGVPETRVLENLDAAGSRVPDNGFFPAVLKPHRSVVTVDGRRRKVAVIPVADAVACRRVLAALPPSAYPVLLQRHVVGAGEGFFALRWGGRTVAMFAHRRLREKPPSGGVSVYRESIPLHARLVEPGLRLLDALDWQGVAMVECKREAATGRAVIMEVNGRFWGSLQLAIDAGVDFPVLLARCAAGETVPESSHYQAGVRSRWFWGDVDHLYLRLRDGGGSRMRAVLDFLRVRPGRDREEIWRWRDPLPFLVETLRWFIPGTNGAKSRSTAGPTESLRDSAARRDAPAAAAPPLPARSIPGGAGARATARR
jgi:predicted ATP-grasp superfamily ATP-dependent carboligase